MLRNLLFFVVALTSTSYAFGDDWLTWRSAYTHDPSTNQRVAQFSRVGPVYVYGPPNYVKSGYRNIRSSIQVGGSADNLHIVEEWGNPVVPYEQWRFNTRPYGAAPYQAWGPPFAGAAPQSIGPVFGYGYGGYGNGGYGPGGGQMGPGQIPNGGGFNGGSFGYPPVYGPGSGNSYPYYDPSGPRQWTDGYYPSYDLHDRTDYNRPYSPGGGFLDGPFGRR